MQLERLGGTVTLQLFYNGFFSSKFKRVNYLALVGHNNYRIVFKQRINGQENLSWLDCDWMKQL